MGLKSTELSLQSQTDVGPGSALLDTGCAT